MSEITDPCLREWAEALAETGQEEDAETAQAISGVFHDLARLRAEVERLTRERDEARADADRIWREWWTAATDALVAFGHSPGDVDEIDPSGFAHLIGEEVKEQKSAEARVAALEEAARPFCCMREVLNGAAWPSPDCRWETLAVYSDRLRALLAPAETKDGGA